MNTRSLQLALVVGLLAAAARGQDGESVFPIDLDEAQAIFEEAKALSDADGGARRER